jgi:hypothetical protein
MQLTPPHILLVDRVRAGGVDRASADIHGAPQIKEPFKGATHIIDPWILRVAISKFERIRVVAGAASSEAGQRTALEYMHVQMYDSYWVLE